MIKKKIKVPIYDWEILYLHLEQADDILDMESSMGKFGIIPGDLDEIVDHMNRGVHGGGKCYPYEDGRKLVILIYPKLNNENFHGTVAHEIFHCAHSIMTNACINDEEAWAYLIGYITQNLSNSIAK